MILVLVPLLAATPVVAQNHHKALILSSLEQLVPMGYYAKLVSYELARAGYQVTFIADTAVTLDFLLTQLNNYDVIIWRTNTYTWNHKTYWYVGEVVNSATQQKYGTDFAQDWVDGNAGILGVSADFFSNHFTSGSLGNVRLMLLISSNSNSFASFLISAGSRAVVFANGRISLTFGIIDDLTGALVAYLASGESVMDSVYNLVSPFANRQPRDPLDSSYSPPFWFFGDAALTIT